jgi:hypothetical protein
MNLDFIITSAELDFLAVKRVRRSIYTRQITIVFRKIYLFKLKNYTSSSFRKEEKR